MNIRGSVGAGGVNFRDDVQTVQSLLNRHAPSVNGLNPLVVDGVVGPKTIQAIQVFQKVVVKMSFADGRVDVGMGTWQALVKGGNGPGGPGASPGIDPGLNPGVDPIPGGGGGNIAPITMTISHGGKVPTNTIGATPTITDMYESSISLSGGISGTFRGSIFPKDLDRYGKLVDGTYPLHIGFHHGGGGAPRQEKLEVLFEGIRCGLLVNARNSVPVTCNDPLKTTAGGVNVHNGFNSGRGSEACVTIQPNDWSRFISLFIRAFPNIEDWHALYTNTGKNIGQLIVRT